jgi:hypothetical protein
MIPRAELPWETMETVFRRGQNLRFSRENLAPLTFRVFGNVASLTDVLEQNGASVKVVRDWPAE